jgi:hypothetical protein
MSDMDKSFNHIRNVCDDTVLLTCHMLTMM